MLQRVSDDPFALRDATEERNSKGDHEIVMRQSFHRLYVAFSPVVDAACLPMCNVCEL